MFRPEPVYVNIWVTHLGGSSFEFGYTVAERDSSVVYAQASSGMVMVSRVSGRPVRLSGPQRHALETWLGEPVKFSRRPSAAKAGRVPGVAAAAPAPVAQSVAEAGL